MPFCDQEVETIQHLLLGCVLSREVWASTLAHWVGQGGCRTLTHGTEGQEGSLDGDYVSVLVPLVTLD